MPFLFFSILAGEPGQHDIRVVKISADYWRRRDCAPSTRSLFGGHDSPPIELCPTLGSRVFRDRHRFVRWSDIESVNGHFQDASPLQKDVERSLRPPRALSMSFREYASPEMFR